MSLHGESKPRQVSLDLRDFYTSTVEKSTVETLTVETSIFEIDKEKFDPSCAAW